MLISIKGLSWVAMRFYFRDVSYVCASRLLVKETIHYDSCFVFVIYTVTDLVTDTSR